MMFKPTQKFKKILHDQYFYHKLHLEGPAQCGKSKLSNIIFAIRVLESPADHTLFAAIGYTSASAKINIGNDILDFLAEKGSLCKYQSLDAIRVKTKTGLKHIVFCGGSTVSSNNNIHGYRIQYAIVDEADRIHKNMIDELDQRETTFPDRLTIYTNNPTVPTHAFYKYSDEQEKRGILKYYHFTLKDNPIMSNDRIEEIKNQYDPDSVYYKRYILGIRFSPESQVYNLKDENIFSEIDPSNYIQYVISIDPGYTSQATSICCLAIRNGYEQIDVVDEYYLKNNDTMNKRPDSQTAIDLNDFINKQVDFFGRPPRRVFYDNASVNFKQEFDRLQRQNHWKYVIFPCYKDKVENRVNQEINLLWRNRLRIYNKCEKTIQAFKSAVYDQKLLDKGELTRLKDIGDPAYIIDPLDALEYAIADYRYEIQKMR